jgi:hypothetical protein
MCGVLDEAFEFVVAQRQAKGCSDQVSSTRSGGMNLARRFNRGPRAGSPRGVVAPGSGYYGFRRVATIESGPNFKRRYATRTKSLRNPGLKRPG